MTGDGVQTWLQDGRAETFLTYENSGVSYNAVWLAGAECPAFHTPEVRLELLTQDFHPTETVASLGAYVW